VAESFRSPFHGYFALKQEGEMDELDQQTGSHFINRSYGAPWIITRPVIVPEGTFSIQVDLAL
jgi:hypothetical protein